MTRVSTHLSTLVCKSIYQIAVGAEAISLIAEPVDESKMVITKYIYISEGTRMEGGGGRLAVHIKVLKFLTI